MIAWLRRMFSNEQVVKIEVIINVAPIHVLVDGQTPLSPTQENKQGSGSGVQPREKEFTLNTPPEITDDDRLSEIGDKLKATSPREIRFGEEKD